MKIPTLFILIIFQIISVEAQQLKLPAGFKATLIVEELGRNRHIAVNRNGDIYVKLEKLLKGKGIVVLRDAGKGKYEIIKSFGNYTGTGIAIKGDYLFASSDGQVFRYHFQNNEIVNPEKPDIIVTDLLEKGQHSSKSITLDNSGNIYVNIGAPSNSCQERDRTPGSPGQDPCPWLDKAAAIWQFKADKFNQTYKDGLKYGSGIRNTVGLDWNTEINQLFVMQHGRDELHQDWPAIYDEKAGAELPAEEMFMVTKGSDFGWPYCYYDQLQKKKVLSPEYGGDGKEQGRCAKTGQPLMAFPGHWAPNALLFYTGTLFPEKYRNGAFIAFHGSWNRSPLPQKGFNVVFVPFKNGMPSGQFEIFADGFAGAKEISSPGEAKARPCGLAQGPDGALYISDSVNGKIWKISFVK